MLRELKTFIAVARYGTFAGAGERIGLTQSAVSAQIQRLEASLGFPLFDRTGRSATLNAAGRDALALAENIVAMADRLGEQGGSNEQRGLVRVGAIASAQASFLVDALIRFRAEFPHCRTRILPGVSLDLLGLVDAGEIDLAVLIRTPFAVPADLEWRTLVAEPFVLLAPAGLPGDDWRALLETAPFIRYDRRSFGGRRVDQFLRDQCIAVQEAIELDELQAMVQLVARGQGVALAPRTFAQGAWPAGVRALALGDDTFYREIGLVERPRHSRQAIAGRLADCIDAAARQMALA
ncbi:LysR family transcriptional regulator [Ralstonia solanacearum]|uniref:LysR family transcriptional regulator n=1 Tax=Ralstonia solanacearum TaxID=305 RepID=UPI00078D16A4|nr:LysR family transcriptional regulator [Ralstonia solanacearum]AMP39274.1 LysR family transcriptional regulator [Ralstonia solanacearum]AXV88107.1 LysR family transcriptional regulator [Ralstonia solanacearum]AXW07592.1 LysR family transcriptional regulator [Ralstonia solanacearum]AXW25382.1 LysR family transcriptional regulator [Ralstonia solanacearum]AXW82294.1 LysR family transcriptional regulator [Ralstonia solanacearum]